MQIVIDETNRKRTGLGCESPQLHHNNTGSFVIVHKTKQGALIRGYYNNASYAEPVLL